jgi:SAM-dependent methyltransferase
LENRAPYLPSQYWRRLLTRGDLSAVGQSGLPAEINAWLYATVARSVDRFMRRHDVRLEPPQSAFEVGAGIGYWLPLWRSLGAARVDGCDLVQEAAESLNASMAPEQGRFHAVDISQPECTLGESHDFVAVLNVLLHIMDEERFDTALANIARLVAPGGWLFLAEPMLTHSRWERPPDAKASSRARLTDRYVRPLEEAGLRLVAIEAGTALGSNPIEGRSQLEYAAFRGWWMFMAGTCRLAGWNSIWLGRIVRALDPPLLRLGAAPSTKFALFRRLGAVG